MITVLMTTYNCADYISESISSILKQSFKDFELLIIDDGSTDRTFEIIKSFNDIRIRYIRKDHIGRSAALNFGIESVTNKIIALMDADDISHPNRLETQIKILTENKYDIIITNGAYFKGKKVLYYTDIDENINEFMKKLLLHGPHYHPTMMFHRNIILDNGGYNTQLRANEDHDLWLRLKDKLNFYLVKDILYFYRVRPDSLSNNAFIYQPEITYNIQEVYFKDLKNHFGISSQIEICKLKGWREYFYGSCNSMRNEWMKINLLLWDLKMLLAFCISFLPIRYY